MSARKPWNPSSRSPAAIAFGFCLSVGLGSAPVHGQKQLESAESLQTRIISHTQAGEFPTALELIQLLPPQDQDASRAVLLRQQIGSGAPRAAALTALGFRDEQTRNSELAYLRRQMGGSGQPEQGTPDLSGNSGAGFPRAGGITEDDFQPLIDLITGTVSPNSWEDQDGPASIRPYASGVYVDQSATLRRLQPNSQRLGNLLKKKSLSMTDQSSWFEDSGNRNPQGISGLRKISLNRLERAAELQFAMGLPIDGNLLNMAGLTEIQYVFVDQDRGEIVIAGPAGPWKYDSIHRAVNSETGRPVLQLEDFVVLLRNAFQNSGRFGCSIDPRAENLTAVQELLAAKRSPNTQWKQKLRAAMGQQDIVVFGIDPQTHAARVLVEADHHMKLVGMGLEPSIPEVPSYLARLTIDPDDTTQSSDVVRWWFTARESDLACDARLECFELTGSGVQVLSESELLGDAGQRIHTGTSTGPTQGYARDFSKHFAKMAARYPVYHELQNLFSLALVANLIKHQKLDRRTEHQLLFFKGTTGPAGLAFPIRKWSAPRQVDSVMNEKVFEFRKANSMVRNTVVAVSGGVEFDASLSLKPDRIKEIDHPQWDSLKDSEELDAPVWWWD